MKTQIPLYRAKKIDSDEYVEGFLIIDQLDEKPYLMKVFDEKPSMKEWIRSAIDIDPSTLAIHMEDMLDSEGTEIFASLSEDGKGGDIVNDKSWGMDVVFIQARRIYAIKVNGNFLNAPKYLDALVKKDLKVIGIQE